MHRGLEYGFNVKMTW